MRWSGDGQGARNCGNALPYGRGSTSPRTPIRRVSEVKSRKLFCHADASRLVLSARRGTRRVQKQSEPRRLLPTREALSRRIVKRRRDASRCEAHRAALEEAGLNEQGSSRLGLLLGLLLCGLLPLLRTRLLGGLLLLGHSTSSVQKVRCNLGRSPLLNARRSSRVGHTTKQKTIPILGSRSLDRLHCLATFCNRALDEFL